MQTKWIGAMGLLFAVSFILRKTNISPVFHLDPAAEAELKKVLMYAAPPTFLATVSSVEQQGNTLRWMD